MQPFEMFFFQLAKVLEEALGQLEKDKDIDSVNVDEVEVTPHPHSILPHGFDMWTVLFPQFAYYVRVRAQYRYNYWFAQYEVVQNATWTK